MSVLHNFFGDARWSRISETIARHERAAIPQSHPMPTVQECFGRLVSLPTAVITLLPGDVATDVLEFHGLRMGQEIDVVRLSPPGPPLWESPQTASGKACASASQRRPRWIRHCKGSASNSR
jgi:hypothetical protein